MNITKLNDGPKPLAKARQEAFCQALTGFPPLSVVAAYKKAGYNPTNAKANAARMMENDGVSKRIAFLRAANAAACQLSKDEALNILADIARAKITDYMDADGTLSVKRREKTVAVSSLKSRRIYAKGEDIGEEREIRLRDPREAIETIAKMCGWFMPEKHEVSGRVVEIVRHDDGRG